jgi:hypothetical protein
VGYKVLEVKYFSGRWEVAAVLLSVTGSHFTDSTYSLRLFALTGGLTCRPIGPGWATLSSNSPHHVKTK